MRRFDRASILIIVLWVLCLLAVFSVVAATGLRQRLALIYKLEEIDKLHYIADAGAKIAISNFKAFQIKGYDSLSDGWADNPELFAKIPVSGGFASVSYDYFDDCQQSRQVKYGFIDEERKININTAPVAVLERLLGITLGLDEARALELASCIIDWRDADSGSNAPSGSSEDLYYTSLQFPYEAKDSAFQAPEELLLVKGMDQAAFDKLRDQVTIFGNGKVNVNTASAVTLTALGMGSDMAQIIVALRNGEDEQIGTPDDCIFETISDISGALGRVPGVTPQDIEKLNPVITESLKTSSVYFSIRSKATLPNRKAKCEVFCTLDREGKLYYWREQI